MTRARLYLFDTTLRDGAQTTGVDFSLADKRAVAAIARRSRRRLCRGRLSRRQPARHAVLRREPRPQGQVHRLRHDQAGGPLGRQRSRHRRAARRQGGCDLLRRQDLGPPGRARARHQPRGESRGHPRQRRGRQGARARGAPRLRAFLRRLQGQSRPMRSPAPARPSRPARAGSCCATPMAARCPTRSSASSARSRPSFPGDHLGIHAHNDTEQAVANSLAAVRAGVRQIQGTLNGLGERCGNANLTSLIPTLLLKPDYAERLRDRRDRREACAPHAHVAQARRAPQPHARPPCALCRLLRLRDQGGHPCLRRGQGPEDLRACAARERSATSASSSSPTRPGRSNILAELERLGIRVDRDDRRLARLLDELKEKEAQGYAYEGADASFFLLASRILGTVPEFFFIERYSVNVERRWNARGDLVSASEAIVKVRVGEEELISAAEGNGPVNALDTGAAQGSRQVPGVHRGPEARRLQGPRSSRAARTR